MREEVKLIIPASHYGNRQHSLRLGVLCPNILIPQLHYIDHPGARKIYYLLLAQNHWDDENTRVYHIPFSDVYRSAKNRAERGPEIKERIRIHAQEKSFHIPPSMAKELFGAHGQSDFHLSPIESVEFIDKHFVIELTKKFKRLMHLTRKGYTKGDLDLLLSFRFAPTDLFYWYIRSQQYNFTYKELRPQDWKEMTGYAAMRTDNFTGKILPKAQEELKGTWAEFRYNIKYKGRTIKTIRLEFASDSKLEALIKNDLRYSWEFSLLKEGVDLGSIMAIRRKIIQKERVGESHITWCAAYVEYNLYRTRSLHAAGKVTSIKDFVLKSLENGSFLSHYEKKELPDDSLGFMQHIPSWWGTTEAITMDDIAGIAQLRNIAPEQYLKDKAAEGIVYHEYVDHTGTPYLVPDTVHTSIVEYLLQQYYT